MIKGVNFFKVLLISHLDVQLEAKQIIISLNDSSASKLNWILRLLISTNTCRVSFTFLNLKLMHLIRG